MPAVAKVAAIDIGTNSVLLVIAATEASGPRPLLERATITRMGEGVDKTRQLAPAAVERNLACLRAYAADLREHGNPPLDVVGTSALRDAQGAEEFLDEAERILGVRPRVIAGDEEARLTFRGALSGLQLRGKLLVFDIGGGSTELIVGDAEEAKAAAPPRSRVSLDIGSVRLFERHVHSDPPRPEELASIEAQISAELDAAEPLRALAAGEPVTLVGVAGTVTTLKALELGLVAYDAARVHGAVLTLSSVEALSAQLSALSLAERVKLPGLEPKRADVIVAGALIVRELLRRAGAAQAVVSDRGVRFGLLEMLSSR
ncbi:MAG TPA: Ppx/GppA phosphatase family protein [Polyangiaceae bacterium]|nr:Ppx/GppA phosphatase family protein [Polyangiaceae bacterium]